jgi:hypothetical protein
MSRLHVLLAAAAGLATATIAHADLFSSINSMDASGIRWYNDFPGSTLTVTNGGMPSIRFQDSNFIGGNWTNRHHAALAAGGVAYNFGAGNQSFQMDLDVTINGALPASTEAGIWVGTAPNWPSSAIANVGNFVCLPDNGGEIAAFGGVLPFFSNNQPANSGMARALRGASRHMTMIYNTSVYGSSMNYGINGVFTGDLPFSGLDPSSLIGVYVQGPNGGPVNLGNVDVTFSNISIRVPTPASATLLGMGGLLAARRRRR